jgi:uncharacterized coiled-coil protein SlyX
MASKTNNKSSSDLMDELNQDMDFVDAAIGAIYKLDETSTLKDLPDNAINSILFEAKNKFDRIRKNVDSLYEKAKEKEPQTLS